MKVYFAPQSRAVRTVWLLEEIGQPYELIKFTLGQKEMRAPEYTRINPNGRVPTLVDGDVTITESTAIAQYLAAKYAKLMLAMSSRHWKVTRSIFTNRSAASADRRRGADVPCEAATYGR